VLALQPYPTNMSALDVREAYKAAGVVFFTSEAGSVKDVLLALEGRKMSVKMLGAGGGVDKQEKGPEASNKITTDVLVFPQGRREKKDEGDPVETAMREYHEETGNFGALTEHLLRFYEDPEDGSDEQRPAPAASFAMYFRTARMVVVFCEVPMNAFQRSLQPLNKANFTPMVMPQTEEATADKRVEGEAGMTSPRGQPAGAKTAGAGASEDGGPPNKRRKFSGKTYKVGREMHLTPVWVSAEALRSSVRDSDANPADMRSIRIECTVCPRKSIDGTGHVGVSGPDGLGQEGTRRSVPWFPLNFSVFREREARIWLGLASPPAAEGKECRSE